jgi:hypothetical protein
MAIKIGGLTDIALTPSRKIDVGKVGSGFSTGTSSAKNSSGAAQTMSDEDVLGHYIDEMYERYKPEETEYEALSTDEIKESVASWLRPSYEQAIAERKAQTETNKANLDADAIARGMGASTYVTDVKNRQQNAEASDVAGLKSDYGAALAKYVSEEADSENDRFLETQQFNAEQQRDAYELAYSAALQLFAYYKKSGGGKSSGGSSSQSVTTTSLKNIETFLDSLSGDERAEVYGATTSAGAQYRSEILASVGYGGYIQLLSRYPSRQ